MWKEVKNLTPAEKAIRRYLQLEYDNAQANKENGYTVAEYDGMMRLADMLVNFESDAHRKFVTRAGVMILMEEV